MKTLEFSRAPWRQGRLCGRNVTQWKCTYSVKPGQAPGAAAPETPRRRETVQTPGVGSRSRWDGGHGECRPAGERGEGGRSPAPPTRRSARHPPRPADPASAPRTVLESRVVMEKQRRGAGSGGLRSPGRREGGPVGWTWAGRHPLGCLPVAAENGGGRGLALPAPPPGRSAVCAVGHRGASWRS